MSDYLPRDVFLEIMKRLSVKSLSRFKAVSSEWKNRILSDDFAALVRKEEQNPNLGVLLVCNQTPHFFAILEARHLVPLDPKPDRLIPRNPPPYLVREFPEIEFPIRKIIGSVDGLVCLRNYLQDLYVVNPRNNHCLRVSGDPGYPASAFALGRGDSGYIIVKIVGSLLCVPQRVRILDLKTNEWGETLEYHLEDWKFELQYDCPGIFIDKYCMWIGKRMAINQKPRASPDWDSLILFDCKNNTFRSIDLPEELKNKRLELELLHVSDNVAAVWDSENRGSIFIVDVSTGMYQSMTVNSGSMRVEYRPISLIGSGSRFLMLEKLTKLSIFDISQKGFVEYVQFPGSSGRRLMATNFRDSLITTRSSS